MHGIAKESFTGLRVYIALPKSSMMATPFKIAKDSQIR